MWHIHCKNDNKINGLQHTVACIFLKIKHLNPVYQQKNGLIEHTTNLFYLVKNIVMS